VYRLATRLATYIALPGRGEWRNANIYTYSGYDYLIGGLWIAEGITNVNLYSMVEIFCTFSDTFDLPYDAANGPLVERDQNQLQAGKWQVTSAPQPLIATD